MVIVPTVESPLIHKFTYDLLRSALSADSRRIGLIRRSQKPTYSRDLHFPFPLDFHFSPHPLHYHGEPLPSLFV